MNQISFLHFNAFSINKARMGKVGSKDMNSTGKIGDMVVLDNNTAVVLLLHPLDSHICLMTRSLPQVVDFVPPK
jgi:hypothetical protein